MTSPLSPPPASPPAALPSILAGRAIWVAILGAALLLRLIFVATARSPWLWPDAREFEMVARSLYEHGTFGAFTLRPPGYPTLIAAVYLVFGPNLIALRLVEAGLSVLSVGLIGAVGTRLFGRRAGVVSAALAAIHPVMAFLPTIHYSETTLVLVVSAAFAAMLEAWRRGEWWRWAVSGMLWGVALLVRPNTVLVLPGLAVGLAFALHRERRAWLVPALTCLTAMALTVSPWIIRNHRVHGQWFFISTGGGRQLWLGNNPRAEADSRVSGFLPDSLMQTETSQLPNDVERERYFYRQGLSYMRAHPGRAVVLYLRELRNLFALYPETRHRLHINAWSRSAQGLASAVIFAGALMALGCLRSEPALWPLAGSVLSFALGSSFYFAILRYRMTVEPCLLWMAGVGWDFAMARWGRPKSVAPPPPAG